MTAEDTPICASEAYAVWSEGNQGMGEEYAEYVVPAATAKNLEIKLRKAIDLLNARIRLCDRCEERVATHEKQGACDEPDTGLCQDCAAGEKPERLMPFYSNNALVAAIAVLEGA